jgi:hypothetical protein
MIINARHQLGFPPAGQRHPADDVHLPQLHRRVALPPPVLTLVQLLLRLDQAIADQHPVHRRLPRRCGTTPAQLVHDPPGTPPRMLAPQPAHQRLQLSRQPARAGPRPPRPVSQPRHTLG